MLLLFLGIVLLLPLCYCDCYCYRHCYPSYVYYYFVIIIIISSIIIAQVFFGEPVPWPDADTISRLRRPLHDIAKRAPNRKPRGRGGGGDAPAHVALHAPAEHAVEAMRPPKNNRKRAAPAPAVLTPNMRAALSRLFSKAPALP